MDVQIRRIIVAVCGLAVLILASWLIWRDHSAQDTVAPVAFNCLPIESPTGDYVGSAVCQSCHESQHSSWHDSYHRTMTQAATEESVRGDFGNIQFSVWDLDVRLFKEGSQFKADLNFKNSPMSGVYTVVMTTGSHNQQVYWLALPNDSQLRALPYLYLLDERRWIPRHSAFLNDICLAESPVTRTFAADSDRWKRSCIYCHATHGLPQPLDKEGKPSAVPHVSEFGISCEACHGPSAGHVKMHRDHLAEPPERDLVHRAQLPHDRSSQVCGQCHGVFLDPSAEARKIRNQNGFSFRPGDDLFTDSTRYPMGDRSERAKSDPLRPKMRDSDNQANFWPDGMSRATGREFTGLIGSPCYIRGTLSCLSCHEMHQKSDDTRKRTEWAANQLKPGMDGNRGCVQCHSRFNNTGELTLHTHHAADSPGSKCYNCHMPYTSYGLLKAARSHQVNSPSVAESLHIGRPNACNQCHQDKTLAWTAYNLESWYKQPKPEMPGNEERIAASLLWALRGDAGQRAITAWTFGWPDAHQASGTHWQAPYLAQLLDDPYDAVRLIAHRSLKRLPGFGDFNYDFAGAPETRRAATQRAVQAWKQFPTKRPFAPQTLIDPTGCLMDSAIKRLFNQRDNRLMLINE